ncbi:hypothetical protein [Lacihabitans soyangensis]|uniref:Tetratricopeptide repeat protein n=1 Tax=Lacihabitans soyangensis TaxID=869394 RepID=A0AAE3KU40_9BACT|nr:hypothetical protein [Lacihabitans soyangensis]MCP9764693.1 hypothetical protein [Lacihabitans soyangensis]
MEKTDFFDEYLRGKMSQKDKELFEKSLDENEATKANFLNYQAAIELLKYDGLKQEVRNAHRQFKAEKTKTFDFPVVKIAVVVVFGLLSLSVLWAGNTNGDELLTELPIHYIEPNNRGANEEKAQAELLYLRNDFKGVIDIFQTSKAPNEKLVFLATMSFYNTNNYEKAIELISQNENKQMASSFDNEYEFYKCQSFIGLNKYADALKVIEKMNNQNPYKQSYNWKYLAKIKILALKERLF